MVTCIKKLGMKERNKSKDDAVISNLGVWAGGSATDTERRAERAVLREELP